MIAEPTIAEPTISVIGLGYVGLPLAIALAKYFDTTGYDIDQGRVAQLRDHHDRTNEIDKTTLARTALKYIDRAEDLTGRDIYIVTVPTPVDEQSAPDLSALTSASELVGAALGTGAIVVYESTVYPGVTEDHCAPILEQASGLRCGVDFFLGYSPERINPGDREHTIDRITKIVAGQTPEIAKTLSAVYGRVTSGGIHLAPNIKTAEAAKAIENAQRDINIAFINEISMILGRLGLSALEVMEAAETKWNFLPFRPGLVGGHCIGVDPYYLAHAAESVGLHPEIVLAGRKINDAMGDHIAGRIWDLLEMPAPRILLLGLTFKENVPDLRNSRIVDIVTSLRDRGAEVSVHDPLADQDIARDMLGFDLTTELESGAPYDAVIGAVQHDFYRALEVSDISALVGGEGLVCDIKGMWRHLNLAEKLKTWQL